MIDRFRGFLCSEDVAIVTQKNQRWIQSLRIELIALGYAKNIGRSLIFNMNDCHYDIPLFEYLTDKTKRDVERKKIERVIECVQDWEFKGLKDGTFLDCGGTVILKPGFSFRDNSHMQKESFNSTTAALSCIKKVSLCQCEECQILRL